MELDRYYELRTILQLWLTRLAESIRGRIEHSARRLQRLQRMHEAEGVGEEFTLWLDRWCRQAAIQFILRILFLRVLEDRELLGVTRIRTTDGQQMWASLTRNLGAAGYVQWCCWDAAHLLPDLFGPTEYDLVLPDDELVQRFLDDVWRRPDPDRPGWLRFDFRPIPERKDEGFRTRFIGDLYQELDAEIRARYALLQTPHFISQFILEHTLLKRFEEKDFRDVTLIDPTCGSGHFLVDAFRHYVDRYEAAELGSETALTGGFAQVQRSRGASISPTGHTLPSQKRAAIARTIIETHLHGCDINPYATALTRFRLILAACDYAQPTSLADFRDLHFNVVTIDSLIPYEDLAVGGIRAGTALARLLGQPEAIERALLVLRRRYDVAIGNPPYILPQDPVKNDLYRQSYASAYLKYGLSAPFTERFINLLTEDGRMGLINSNAFTKRHFGEKLIEEVLPQYDLEAIVDLSGAYIPGHGTPTIMLFVRKRPASSSKIKFVSSLKGEPGIPNIPSQGVVWQEIVRNFESEQYDGETILISYLPRVKFNSHPWNLKIREEKIIEQLNSQVEKRVTDFATLLATSVITGRDDLYVVAPDAARRIKIPKKLLRPYVFGVDVRDWVVSPTQLLVFPYEGTDTEPVEIEQYPEVQAYFSPFRSMLASRTSLSGQAEWFELCRMKYATHQDPRAISGVLVATHNHFAFDQKGFLFQQGVPAIKLAEEYKDTYLLMVSVLNTNSICFYLKQVCYNKGSGDDPVRDRYQITGAVLGQIPLPKEYKLDEAGHFQILTALTEKMNSLAGQVTALNMRKLFEKSNEAYHTWNCALDGYTPPHPALPPPFSTARELRAARDQLVARRQDIRGRMIFLQEEMDWLAYEMYGLLKSKAPLAEDFLSQRDYATARLELGQRPFEVAGKGYTGDWPQKYKPAPLPAALRPLTEERIAVIKANPDIALLEDPLYKRRWVPPDYDREFREAAAWWLAEKLEYALEQAGRPLSLREWARLLARDERVNAVLEVLTGSPTFDLKEELLKIIRANAVPNRPEHYLKPAGLRKLYAAKGSDSVPEYKRGDFSDGAAWKLRGKLNIPRERFIHYAEFNHTGRRLSSSSKGEGREGAAPDNGGPWFGWAGWAAPQRADALATLLDKANRAGWEVHFRQCGLRAALRDLLPELTEMPAADRAEFEAIAGLCSISLDTPCYCRAYRDGLKQEQPGVPGVTTEALGVKALPSAGRKPAGREKKEDKDSPQLQMDI